MIYGEILNFRVLLITVIVDHNFDFGSILAGHDGTTADGHSGLVVGHFLGVGATRQHLFLQYFLLFNFTLTTLFSLFARVFAEKVKETHLPFCRGGRLRLRIGAKSARLLGWKKGLRAHEKQSCS